MAGGSTVHDWSGPCGPIPNPLPQPSDTAQQPAAQVSARNGTHRPRMPSGGRLHIFATGHAALRWETKRSARTAPNPGTARNPFFLGVGGQQPQFRAPPPPKKKEGKRKKETDVQAVLEPCNAVDCLQWLDQVTWRSLATTQYPIPAPYVYPPTFQSYPMPIRPCVPYP